MIKILREKPKAVEPVKIPITKLEYRRDAVFPKPVGNTGSGKTASVKTFNFPIKGQDDYVIPIDMISTFWDIEAKHGGGAHVLLKDFVRVGSDSATTEFITTLSMAEIKKGIGWA